MSISPVGNAYTFKSLADDTIMIGDVADADFHPKFTLNRWHGECWLKLEFDDSQIPENQRNVNLVENKVKWSSPLFDFHYYPLTQAEQHEDGGLEFEIVLKSKPLTNRFSFPIQTRNLVWHYQLPLNQELDPKDYDILTATEAWKNGKLRVHRPERIVGSYAFYHNSKSSKQYKAGKAFHLPIPEIVDAIGNRTFGSYNTDVQETGVLTITLPQEFLDSAVYPITIDPTFGYTDIGSSETSEGGDESAIGCKFSVAEAGTLTKITWYGKAYSGTQGSKGVFYANNAGTPTARLNLSSNDVSLNTTFANREYTMNYAFNAGTYWLFAAVNDGGVWRYDSGGVNQWAEQYPIPDYTNPPNPASNLGYQNWIMTIWADYTTGATVKTVTDSSNLSDSVLRNKTLVITDSSGLSDSVKGDKTPLIVTEAISALEQVLRDKSLTIADFVSLLESMIAVKFSPVQVVSSGEYATGFPHGRDIFYANGRYWIFYYKGGANLYTYKFISSTDGITWDNDTVFHEEDGSGTANGWHFSAWLDGTTVHVVLAIIKPSAPQLIYRKGTLNSDGTITWAAAEQVIINDHSVSRPMISVDSSGYPWIVYLDTGSSNAAIKLTKSSTNDGTWTTESGFPYTLRDDSVTGHAGAIIPLTSGKMYMAYSGDASPAYGRLWNGSLGNEETISANNLNGGSCFSFVAISDNVFLGYQTAAMNVYFLKRTYGVGWGSETQIGSERSIPVLSKVKNAEKIACVFRLHDEGGGKGTVYLRLYDVAGNSWGDEEIIALNQNIADSATFSASYLSTGDSDRAAVVWTTNTASPYYVTFTLIPYLGGAIIKTVTDIISFSETVLRNKGNVTIADSVGESEVVLRNKLLTIIDSIGESESVYSSKLLQVAEAVSLAEVVYVGAEGVKKTRLFLIVGDLAVQLTGE